ncbi:MAG: TonB-dependent receptor plug domain-containing protein, partial [Thiotrichaceae bacterium]|nr:TonB-dependent receptor plug domain-containing protein [Thiotrichaceae bacterium]
MKRITMLLVFFMALGIQVFAQSTITGTVTGADDGQPLPGVTVAVKGFANAGTITDVDGNYSVKVPEGGTVLVFSFMGLQTAEVAISGSVVNATLSASDIPVDDVIVTALGVTREKKSLGYAVQEIDGGAVNEVRETNFVNSLSGKVAGVQIRQSNTMGGSANILIRGTTSLTGNNQALFVVDGVPIDNTINNDAGQAHGSGGYDYGNAAMDINPDDIETISVLKGAAATVLYGSRASNGVILITTKKGRKGKGIGITVNSDFVMSMIDKTTMPEHQTEYGAGYGPYYSESDMPQFLYDDLDGDGTMDYIVATSEDASWGAKYDPNLMVFHWDAMIPGEDGYLEKRAWTAGENGIDYFFQTGMKFTNNIAIDGGNDKATFRLSYTNVDETGLLPNSSITKNTVNFSGDY